MWDLICVFVFCVNEREWRLVWAHVRVWKDIFHPLECDPKKMHVWKISRPEQSYYTLRQQLTSRLDLRRWWVILCTCVYIHNYTQAVQCTHLLFQQQGVNMDNSQQCREKKWVYWNKWALLPGEFPSRYEANLSKLAKKWGWGGISVKLLTMSKMAANNHTMDVWVLSRYAGFLPQLKQMHIRLTGNSKLSVGVNVSADACVGLSRMHPAFSLR